MRKNVEAKGEHHKKIRFRFSFITSVFHIQRRYETGSINEKMNKRAHVEAPILVDTMAQSLTLGGRYVDYLQSM